MTENERDTKFLGFAHLLQEDLLDAQVEHYHDYDKEDYATLIAQRAYDLAYHVLYETGSGMERAFGIPYKLEQVPDLTKWADSPEPE